MTLAVLIAFAGWLDYRATVGELQQVLRSQADAMHATIAAAARVQHAASAEAERALGQRLLENARLLAAMDARGGLDAATLDRLAQANDMFRVVLFEADAAGRTWGESFRVRARVREGATATGRGRGPRTAPGSGPDRRRAAAPVTAPVRRAWAGQREERRTGGDLPPAIVWTPPLFYEDGVYDGPYVIDAKTWREGAKHAFASGHEVSGWASYSDRSYTGLLREDTLTRAGVELLAPLVNGATAALDGVGRYSFFRNSSSEALETSRAHQVSAGLCVAF